MNNIGNVIMKFRSITGMSRKELSDGICSEKYIYMIEKGERTPSAGLARRLGDKMGVDLFIYYEYLDCEDPISVHSIIKKFNKYRRENSLKLLDEVTKEAMRLPDFKKKPWLYEIEFNYYMKKVLSDGDFLNSICKIQEIINNLEQDNSNYICIINFYVLLSTCYQMALDLENAKKTIIVANEKISGLENITRYEQVFTSVKISKIIMHYQTGELDCVIEEGLNLNKYEIETCCHERSHYTQFYLAFAFYQSGLEEKGIEYFINALCVLLIRYKPEDMYYITKCEAFRVIINDKRIPKDLTKLIKIKYSIT